MFSSTTCSVIFLNTFTMKLSLSISSCQKRRAQHDMLLHCHTDIVTDNTDICKTSTACASSSLLCVRSTHLGFKLKISRLASPKFVKPLLFHKPAEKSINYRLTGLIGSFTISTVPSDRYSAVITCVVLICFYQQRWQLTDLHVRLVARLKDGHCSQWPWTWQPHNKCIITLQQPVTLNLTTTSPAAAYNVLVYRPQFHWHK